MKKLVFLALILSLVSCSVQHRKYRHGFYISHFHNTPKSKVQEPALAGFSKRVKPVLNQIEAVPVQSPSTTSLPSITAFNRAPADSCDELIFKDGTDLKGKVVEINSTSVKYKRCDMPDGPLYVVKKSEVFMIRYANGIREVIKQESEPVSTPKNFGSSAPTPPPGNPKYQSKKLNPTALASLIFGIIGFLFLTGILAIRLGNKAIRQIDAEPGFYSGRILAEVGRSLGIIKVSLIILVVLLVIIASI